MIEATIKSEKTWLTFLYILAYMRKLAPNFQLFLFFEQRTVTENLE
jgi:hypothetical protein